MNKTAANPRFASMPACWSAFPETVRFMESIHLDSLIFPLFDSLHDVCFFLKNMSGQILLCNRQLYRRFGLHTEADIIGKTDFDLHPHKLALKYQRDDFYVTTSGKPLVKIIEVFRSETGLPGWYLTDKYPVLSRSGDIVGVMGVIQKYESFRADSCGGRLGELLRYIEENINGPIRLRELAQRQGMSIRAMERVFQEHLGLSPKQYIIRKRILGACEALRSTDRAIADIAMDSGFYDQSAFSRAFKQIMDITPQAYRNLFL